MKYVKIASILAACMLSGCASVGDHVGGPDRCISTVEGHCTLLVRNGVVAGGETVDMYNDKSIGFNVPVRKSGLRHAYDAVNYNGGMFVLESKRPTKKLN